MSFFFIVWHRRLKKLKTPKEGLTVLINEDKELAELRGLAAGVGLANACYAIQCVTGAMIMGHLDEEWATTKSVPVDPVWPRIVLVYAHYSGIIINNTPSTPKCDLGWKAIIWLSYPEENKQKLVVFQYFIMLFKNK